MAVHSGESDSFRGRAHPIPIVGRERELERLRREIAAVRDGSPRVVLVSGEAGIGKSRLLSEAMTLFTHEGGRIALGRCVDETGMPPFLPWIDIGAALGSVDGRSITELLLEPLDASPLNPESRRIRLYGSVCTMLADLTAEQPLLLAFDDLQWSDPASNQLLRYVISHLSSARLLIAGAVRPQEARDNPELAKTIAEIDRERLLTFLPIGALPDVAIDSLVVELAGDVGDDVLAAVREMSGGNPFAIEEIARSFAEQPADAIPAGISTVITRRFESRSPPCRAVLEIAAVGGRDIAVDLIAAALDRDPETVVAALEEAAAAALVVTTSGDGGPLAPDYAFAHDRIREALFAAIPAARRRLLHGHIASALQATAAPESPASLARLAHHLEAARRLTEAGAAYEGLGDVDLGIGAYDDAAIALDRARDLHELVSGDLLIKLGDARMHAGRTDAVEAYADAERAFRVSNNPAGIARALQRTGSARARREEHLIAVASLRAAVAAWSTLENVEPDLIATWTELCTVLGASLGQYDEAIEVGRRALTAASRQGARPDLEASARLALASAQIRGGDLEQGRRTLEPALALALQAHQSDLAAEIAGTLANYAYWTGDLPSSERFARWRRELGIESRDPYALRHTLPWLANVAMARGQWNIALQLIAEAEADLTRIDSPEPRAFLKQLAGMIALQRGEFDAAVFQLEEAIAGFRAIGLGTLPWYLGVLASAYFASGAQADTERIVAETIATVSALPAGALPRAPSIAQLAVIATETSDSAAMRRWQAELRPYRGQHHWVLMDRALGMLADGLGECESADRYLGEAISIAARGQIQPELLLARAERARLASRPDELVAIAAEMTALGMAVPKRYATSQRVESIAKSAPAGLTDREIEVLVQVARGKTNREIAEILSISEKTVTNHLTHIFTKANLDNRAAAVAFALRHGLVE